MLQRPHISAIGHECFHFPPLIVLYTGLMSFTVIIRTKNYVVQHSRCDHDKVGFQSDGKKKRIPKVSLLNNENILVQFPQMDVPKRCLIFHGNHHLLSTFRADGGQRVLEMTSNIKTSKEQKGEKGKTRQGRKKGNMQQTNSTRLNLALEQNGLGAARLEW